MHLRTDIQRITHWPLLLVYQVPGSNKTLVNCQVCVLGMLHPPLVGVGITGESELEAIPVQDEAHGTVQGMYGRDGGNGHTVLLVDHLVDTFVVKLIHLHLEADGIDVALP